MVGVEKMEKMQTAGPHCFTDISTVRSSTWSASSSRILTGRNGYSAVSRRDSGKSKRTARHISNGSRNNSILRPLPTGQDRRSVISGKMTAQGSWSVITEIPRYRRCPNSCPVTIGANAGKRQSKGLAALSHGIVMRWQIKRTESFRNSSKPFANGGKRSWMRIFKPSDLP